MENTNNTLSTKKKITFIGTRYFIINDTNLVKNILIPIKC